MMGHPGKKLLFMGQDFGQFHEWDEKVALDWYLADEPLHKDLQDYCRDLLHLYKKYPACYSQDYDWKGFQWINANDADRSISASSVIPPPADKICYLSATSPLFPAQITGSVFRNPAITP